MNVLTPEFQRSAFAAGQFLRVVNWHNTPVGNRSKLRHELSWYLRHFDPVLPSDLDRFFETGKWGLSRPGFIPAFYDGYQNHVTVAAPVCEELGVKAWFFPPTGFLSVKPEEQEAYAQLHEIDLVAEEKGQPSLAMTWDDLEQISRQHIIAGHTAHHEQASKIKTAEDVEREITEPLKLIESLTGRPAGGFAWLFGRPFDADSLAGKGLLENGVRNCFSNTLLQRIA